MSADSIPMSTGKKRPVLGLKEPDLSDSTKKRKVVNRDFKLIPRMREYLENNRDKQYIDIEDMSLKLHAKYPEYNRQKLRQFRQTVEEAFEKLQQTTSKPNINEGDTSEGAKQRGIKKGRRVKSLVKGKTNLMNSVMMNLYAKKEEPESDLSKIQQKAQTILKKSSSDLSKSKDSTNDVKNKFSKKKDITETSESSKKITVNESAKSEAKAPESKKKIPESEARTPDSKRKTPESEAKTPDSKRKTPESKEKRQSVSQLDKGNLEKNIKSTVSKTATTNGHAESSQMNEDEANRKKVSRARSTSRNPSPTRKRNTKEVGQVTQSKITFADIGGNEDSLKEICTLLFHLRHPEIYEKLGVSSPRGFLLHGPPGCGKTLLANAIAGEIKLPLIKIAATEIVSGVSGESENNLREIFDKANSNAPCILFIDEIDAVTQKRENAQKEMEKRIVSQLLVCMDELNPKVLVIGATNRPDSLDPSLRRAGRFDREIAIGIPDEKARTKILNVLLRGLTIEKDVIPADLARKTPGYVGADLKALVREASVTAINRIFKDLRSNDIKDDPCSDLDELLSWIRSDVEENESITESQLSSFSIKYLDFEKAVQTVQPSSKREGFITVPDVTWEDVGALKEIREELDLAILAPVNNPEKFEELGLVAPAGILLCGPPGCGKTLLAKAVANQAGINFISVKGPELLNMYVGESERAVRQVFQRAQHSAPCVIFFDELDALCPKRSHNSSDGSSRVVNQLLTEMDGVETRKKVFLMAATNRVDIIDPAVLRPGRLDKVLFVDLPSQTDCIEIFKAITKNGSKPPLDKDVSFSELSEKMEGYSGADISALVREASIFAFKEYSLRPKTLIKVPILVAKRHFIHARSKIRPSISGDDKKKYESMKLKYCVTKEERIENEQESIEIEKDIFDLDNLRFLSQMEVRVKDSSSITEFRGKTGIVVSNEDRAFTIRISNGKERVIPGCDLEPFTPGLGERAKLLTTNGRIDDGLVVEYDEDEDDDVTIKFGNEESVIVPIDYLCKVR
ncbi:LOW QUALITY PROTEIN: nuclear valosin-containing protein-like [Lepeophtheirus salmonis]|uniref:LOW QUALITY PROTEIN: nuclear valosin-containing protein-like n=1 Tax=Lepeophtheirus salmonis TaxID=72036 RepID=UPI003AF40142